MANLPHYFEFFPEVLSEGDQCAMVGLPSFKKLTDFIESIPDDIVYQPNSPDYGKEDKPHITLLYGIEKGEKDKAVALLSKIQTKIPVKLGKVSRFTTPQFDVLKIDVTGPKLTEINDLLRKNVKYANEHPNYVPHVTLAYVKKGEGTEFVGNKTFEGMTFLLDTIVYSDAVNKTSFKIPQSIAEYFAGSGGGYGGQAGGAVAANGWAGTYGSPQTSNRIRTYDTSGRYSYMQGNTIVNVSSYDTINPEDLKDPRFMPDEIQAGLRYEMKKMEYPDKEKARKVVIANLEKDPKHYSDLGMYFNSDK